MSEPALRIAGESGGRNACPTGHDDALAAWLRVLEPLLNLPEPERRAIVEELDGHLRERTRDQMLAGVPEAEAVRAAIAELGDAASLARRFREAARTPLRRYAMNLAVLGVAGAALVTSLIAIRGGEHPVHLRVYQPPITIKTDDPREKPPSLSDVTLKNAPLVDVLKYLADASKLELRARWDRLENASLPRGTEVTAEAKSADLAQIFDMINEGRPGSELDFRVHDGQLEVAPRSYFDQREAELVSFDISDIFAQGIKPEELARAITQMVTPHDWQENGGASGSMAIVGQRLFIKAPPRMWRKAAWMLEQIAPAAGSSRSGREGQKVPMLADIPITGPDGPMAALPSVEHPRRDVIAAALDAARMRAKLGVPLTNFDLFVLHGEEVKVLPQNDPPRAELQKKYDDMLQQIEAWKQADSRIRAQLKESGVVFPQHDERALTGP